MLAWPFCTSGNVAILTPTIPIVILVHSRKVIFLFNHKEVNRLIKSGLSASSNVVMPAATSLRAIIKMPRYNVVLRTPKINSCHHCLPCGNLNFLSRKVNASSNTPAIKKRVVNRVNGSDDINPNLPATEADDQRIANNNPEIRKEVRCNNRKYFLGI